MSVLHEQIQLEAIKCRYCGEFLDARPPVQPSKSKWYYSTATLVMAVVCLGPLALPLVWRNPRFNVPIKLAITVCVIGLTIGLFYLTIHMYLGVVDQIKALGIG